MDITQFIVDNYIWIMIVCAFLIFTLIGFIADQSKKKKDNITESNNIVKENEPVVQSTIINENKEVKENNEGILGIETPEIGSGFVSTPLTENNTVEQQPMATESHVDSTPVESQSNGDMTLDDLINNQNSANNTILNLDETATKMETEESTKITQPNVVAPEMSIDIPKEETINTTNIEENKEPIPTKEDWMQPVTVNIEQTVETNPEANIEQTIVEPQINDEIISEEKNNSI